MATIINIENSIAKLTEDYLRADSIQKKMDKDVIITIVDIIFIVMLIEYIIYQIRNKKNDSL